MTILSITNAYHVVELQEAGSHSNELIPKPYYVKPSFEQTSLTSRLLSQYW